MESAGKANEAASVLGAGYEDLAGTDLLEALLSHGRHDLLEAFWRYDDSDIRSSLAPLLARAGSTALSRLLLDFVLDVEAADPPAGAVLTAIGEHEPRLGRDDTDRLIDRLLTPDDLAQPCQSQRGSLEVWALSQRFERADRFAKTVISKQSPCSDQRAVRSAAVRKCAGNDDLLAETCTMLAERLYTEADEASWANATDFLVAAERAGARVRQHKLLAHQLVMTLTQLPETANSSSARRNTSSVDVPTPVASLIQRAAAARMRELFDGDELNTEAPRRALARVALSNPHTRVRWAALKALAGNQAELWASVRSDLVSDWNAEEWDAALAALIDVRDRIDPVEAGRLLEEAPPRCSAAATQLAVALAESDSDPLVKAASQLVQQRVQQVLELDEGPLDVRDAAFWWPAEADERQRAVLKAVLQGVGEEQRVEVILQASSRNLIDADTAATVLGEELTASALREADGAYRQELATACYRLHPEATAGAAKELLADESDLELAAALAADEPQLVFAPLTDRWGQLSATERDRLVSLIEAHSTREQQRLLDAVAQDTHRDNLERRRRVVAKMAELAEPDHEVPSEVLAILQAGNAESRMVGVDAIRRLRPRSLEAVRQLRDVATNSDPAGRDAKRVLEELAVLYVEELRGSLDPEARVDRLHLLGLTAAGIGIDPLLEHLGQEAVEDRAAVRVAAAQALSDIGAADTRFTIEQQQRIGQLLADEGGEDTADARQLLSQVLSRLTLGSDAALKVLYDLVEFDPARDPEHLFGPEREGLVRHLQLYDLETGRGDVGRPQRLEQLDLIALKLLRAAYLRVGTSENLVSKILLGGREPDVGELLQACSSVGDLQAVRSRLGVVHEIRCEKTEYAHPGQQPTPDDETTATDSFKNGAKQLLGVLKEHAGTAWPNR